MVLLIALFSVFGFASAWGTPEDSDRGFGPRRHGRGFHHGMGGKNVTEFIMWRMEKRVKELDLSEEQMEEFKDIQGKIDELVNTQTENISNKLDETKDTGEENTP